MMIKKLAKPSILFIGNFLSHLVGAISPSESLALHLQERGWSILLTSRQVNRPLRLLEMIWTVWEKRKEYQIAHIDIFSGKSFLWAEIISAILSLLRKPVVLTLHGGGLVEFSKRWQARVKRVLKQADVVITPSHFLQTGLRNIREDIQYIPNGMDVSAYNFQLREKVSPTLVWLRAFHEIYNPLLAIETFAIVQKDFPEIQMLMIGPDKKDGTFNAVQKRIAKLGLSKIEIVGAVSKADVPIWLQKGDVFINTTNYESFGVGVMEAAACGLPIVSTAVGELPLLWTNGTDALLVPPNAPKKMAGAITKILREPALAKKLSLNARKKAEKFDWSVILPQWEILFLEVINQHAEARSK